MPKGHRATSTGLVRTHSRSSSSSKLGANLQFTQKDPVADKSKKGHEPNHQAHIKTVGRVNSGQRVHSKEQVQHFTAKRGPVPYNQKPNGTKSKPGFTIASPNDDDEDEWISSESGAATPSHHDSDSDDDSDDNATLDRKIVVGRPAHPSAQADLPPLPRVDTARPSDFVSVATRQERHGTLTPFLPSIDTNMTDRHADISHFQKQNPHRPDSHTNSPIPPSPARRSPHPSHKHHSTRPSSAHSSTRSEQPLRPHPLIRGHSYGQAQPLKPAPLTPLTVIPDSATSTSHHMDSSDLTVSTSPVSTASVSPTFLNPASSSQRRRTSVSSARSVATLPSHSNIREPSNWSVSDRKRTLSTISHSSSSAALSSLVHLPTVTRPPSPQAVSFFPPVNPHTNIEGIHPLLPGPYLNNHLTVLARRNPIKGSFDRVIRARQVRAG
ncbi:hypothetical protein L208DRAFT_1400886 [Tricholoma matsutake]|nr:hypothetical protein L208DRAFT_1400886 [Tricholoma matsutake 945]